MTLNFPDNYLSNLRVVLDILDTPWPTRATDMQPINDFCIPFNIEPPSIIIEPPPEVQLKVGDDVVVRCEAEGKHPLLYQWFKEGQQLKNDTEKELCLTKVKPTDEGLYICRVANVRGYQFSRWIRVVVGKQQAVKSEEDKIPAVPKPENPGEDVITQSGKLNLQSFKPFSGHVHRINFYF